MQNSHLLSLASSSRVFAEFGHDRVLRYADCLQFVGEEARFLSNDPCHEMQRFDPFVTKFLFDLLCDLEYRLQSSSNWQVSSG